MRKDIHSKIKEYLKILRLAGIKESYQEIAEQSARENLLHEEYLLMVLEKAAEARYNSRTGRLLKESGLDLNKSMDTFNMKRLHPKELMQVKGIREGDFLENRENILIFGAPGSGKTHLLSAIAQEQIINRGKKIRATTCSLLVQELLAAKKELQLPAMLKKYAKYDAVLIDDIGYVEQTREEMEILFTFLAHRYEKASLMITSNLAFSKWGKIFKDPMTAAAAIDRLVHHSIILELNLPSARMEEAKQRRIK